MFTNGKKPLCAGHFLQELEIAMQRKSVVKAWNTERRKQKKMTPAATPWWPQSSFVVYFWRKKKKKEIYAFHFLIVFPADSFFFFWKNCCHLKSDPFTPIHDCLPLNYAVMRRWYEALSKTTSFLESLFRGGSPYRKNTVTEKACVCWGGVGGGGRTWIVGVGGGWSVNSSELYIL